MKTLEQRFWDKVTVQGLDDCWKWIGGLNTDGGYGRFWVPPKLVSSHRVVWELAYGPIPLHLRVLHLCDTSLCVNPRHLFLGTMEDNTTDMIAKGRQRHPRGEDHWNAHLTEQHVLEIRNRFVKENLSLNVLGNLYQVQPQTIRAILTGRIWAHI